MACTDAQEVQEDAPTTHVLRDYEVGGWHADETKVGADTLTAEDSRRLLEYGLVYACRDCSGLFLTVYHLLPDVDYDTVQNVVGRSPEEDAEWAALGDLSTDALHRGEYEVTGTTACDVCRPKLDAEKLARLRDGRTLSVRVMRQGSPLYDRVGRVVTASNDGVVVKFPGRRSKQILLLSELKEEPDATR